jgi:hypothetical protein
MVRELLPKLSDDLSSGEHPEDPAPSMFSRPSDVADPLPSVRHGDQVARLHREWIRITATSTGGSSPWQRLIRRLRRMANRVPGSIDREMIADLIRAIDAVAARCDEMADRLAAQQIVVNDAVTIFGEELTRLRAESAPLRGAAKISPAPSPLRNE